MASQSLTALKDELKKSGFENKEYLSDEQMARAIALLDQNERALETPELELRYLEGLLDLPLGFIRMFKIVPAAGYEKCGCGRVPSALDIVYTAYAKRIHERSLIRDTLLGFRNTFEFAEDGRVGECFACGRRIVAASYWTDAYMYA